MAAEDPIDTLLRGLLFTYTSTKDGYLEYVARVSCQLAGRGRYFILYALPTSRSPEVCESKDVRWVNIQTREIMGKPYPTARSQEWNISRQTPDVMMRIVERTPTHTIFGSEEVPYVVHLQNDPKKKGLGGRGASMYQYSSQLHLSSCLFTFKAEATRDVHNVQFEEYSLQSVTMAERWHLPTPSPARSEIGWSMIQPTHSAGLDALRPDYEIL